MTEAEWLSWRTTGIGASESPAIFGASPYHTKRDLWLLKTGQVEPKPISAFANAKGGTNETSLRARYSLETGRDYQPRLAVHDTFPFIKASLDGYDNESATALEIKFVGKDYADKLPDKALRMGEHWIQCQHQILAGGLLYIDYLWSADGINYKKHQMNIDAEFQQELTMALVAFWHLVTTRTDPGYSEDDAKPASDELGVLLKKYKETKDKALRQEIQSLVTWPRMEYQGVTVTLKGDRLTVR